MRHLKPNTPARTEAVTNFRARLTGNEHGHTPNGYDPLWIEAINAVLEDRGADNRVEDLTEKLWDEHIGPMIDEIQDATE